MSVTVDIKHDMGRIGYQIGVNAKERAAAAVRALNRTMTTVKAEGARSIGLDYPGLQVGAIKKRIRLTKASRMRMQAFLDFSNKRLRLFNWRLNRVNTKWGTGVRQTGRLPKTILAVDAVSGRTRELSAYELKSAFIQRSRKHGFGNVWLRQGKASTPIDVLVTPSLSETLVRRRLDASLGRRARERFQTVFAQEAKFRLSKRS